MALYDIVDEIFSILCEDCGHIWKLTKEDFEDESDYAWYFTCPRCRRNIAVSNATLYLIAQHQTDIKPSKSFLF